MEIQCIWTLMAIHPVDQNLENIEIFPECLILHIIIEVEVEEEEEVEVI